MEPITLCGAVIVVFGLWVEFEPVIRKAAKAISSGKTVTALTSSTAAQRPLYVNYMTGNGR